jgi:subtilase family serine protease
VAGTLEPGYPDQVEFTWAPPRKGTFTLRAVVDPEGKFDEFDEYNNELEVKAKVPR